MKLYLVLDESGNLHKNNSVRFFVIGGYITNDSLKARAVFKKELIKYKKKYNIDKDEELKGSMVNDNNKISMLSLVYEKIINSGNIFIPVFIVIDKKNLIKPIEEVNILYNYFIKLIIKRLKALKILTSNDVLDLKLDNKTIKVGSLNTLEEYLIGEFFFENINIGKVSYLDSKKKEEIQLADFICNHYWRFFERKKFFEKFEYNCKKIRVLYFPFKTFGE
ncbi:MULTISPECIES: DUF3800 domain-containing protein [Fusobacterium]|uniref:DUF3800 domain-containing protein n=1 Tax=Fusobacterium TaxID=848 RepID=UPI000E824EBD|nr:MULTISPECIES: DUF3800 domain-containing protein [Fusobacterium]MCF0171652.1 DUF3800 domain-containing protein [Fusobacterium varium]MCF0188835.1 DUF3800 domain-containing protein [Bacteroidaceae bacterium]HBJ80154.1 hypothetical protein [Fusobacterium sp.]